MGAILKELHNSASKFQFPSMPKDDVDVKRETAYQEYNILGKGKMSYPSGMGTQIIKWSGYFWGAGRKKLASVNQKWIAPKTCASKLKSWQTKKTPLNLVVSEAGINEDVTIKSFEYKPFGGHGDYSYEISFVPYVEMKIYTTKELGTKKKAKKKKKTTRPSTKKSTKKKKTYRIVRGDTLCGISRKKYKTESKWRNIYNANKKVIEAAAKKHGRRKGKDVISTPKTKNSVRTVIMPQFLCDEMQDCLKLYYSLKSDDRIFPVTKYYLKHEMERGCKASGVKKIRVHDLRHSHVSLLINMGYTALAIGKRVGHSAEKITYRYAHLFPSVQQDMAEQLDAENMEEELNEVEGGLANVG